MGPSLRQAKLRAVRSLMRPKGASSIRPRRSNYSDLPVWDMLFGTFDNPRRAPLHCGFSDDRETQPGRMLLGKLPR
jgi:hypothetical protein